MPSTREGIRILLGLVMMLALADKLVAAAPVITVGKAVMITGTTQQATVPMGAASYCWTVSNGAITSPSSSQYVISFKAGLPGTTTLQCVVTDASGASQTATKTITVEPEPNATISAPGYAGESQTFVASVPAQQGVTYAWSAGYATIQGPSDQRQVTCKPDTTGSLTGIITCKVTNISTGTYKQNTQVIQYLKAPSATMGTSSFARNSARQVALFTNNQPGWRYVWSVSGDAEFLSGDAPPPYTLERASAKGPWIHCSGKINGSLTLTCKIVDYVNQEVVVTQDVTIGEPANLGPSAPWFVTPGDYGVCAYLEQMKCGAIVKPPNGLWNSDLFEIRDRAETECKFDVPENMGIGVTGHITATGVELNTCPGNQMVPGTLTRNITTTTPPTASITAPASLVEGGRGYKASVPFQNTSYQCQYLWSIDHGTITSGIGTPAITFEAGQVGPTTLSCKVIHYSDRAIVGTFMANVHPKAKVPNIQVPSLIEAPGAVNRTASVTQVGGESYTWTIVGGEITAGKDTRAIQYKVTAADGGVVQLTCTAKDPTGTTSAVSQQSVSVMGPPAVAVTFPKYWPSLSTGAYSFNGGTQMPAEGVRITITETSGGEPRWSGYTGSGGTLNLPMEGSGSASFLLTETGKTFTVSLRPESRFDLGGGQAVEASVILGRFSDTPIILPAPPGVSPVVVSRNFCKSSMVGGSQ